MSVSDGWDWVGSRLRDQEENNIGPDGDGSGGILGAVTDTDGQAQSANLSLPGQADSGRPDQDPTGYVARAVAGSPPSLPDPTPILRFKNGDPVIDPNTGKPYPLPAGMNVSANVTAAASRSQDWPLVRDIWMVSRFATGQPEDYQRPDGYLAAKVGHDYIGGNRDVSGYNFGAVARRAGYSLEDTRKAAGLYNKYFGNPKATDSKYGNDQGQVDVITQGWNDGLKW